MFERHSAAEVGEVLDAHELETRALRRGGAASGVDEELSQSSTDSVSEKRYEIPKGASAGNFAACATEAHVVVHAQLRAGASRGRRTSTFASVVVPTKTPARPQPRAHVAQEGARAPPRRTSSAARTGTRQVKVLARRQRGVEESLQKSPTISVAANGMPPR